ncbi:MAG TPA: hypothetical protein VGO52_01250 [Hyphomonadaceae bacterium]|jgi:hypothetical protein|nr:hypothetical protein [Hyphomonadaceae bacterium]
MVVTEVQGGPAPVAQPSPAGTAAAPNTAAKFKAAAPVAAGALAIVAAIAAGSMFNGDNASAPTELPAAVSETVATSTPPASDPATAPLPVDPAVNPPPVTATPAPAPKPGSSLPTVAFDQAPPAGLAQSMEIVVKFKDDAKIKDIVDAFWKDKSSARTKFDALKARRPEFANLKLDRVTYSNELVLVHESAAGQLGAMRDLAAKLGKSADISYAEPNLTAHPGGQ